MRCVCCVSVKSVLIPEQTFNRTPVMSIIYVGCTRYLKLITKSSLPVDLGMHESNVFHCAAKKHLSPQTWSPSLLPLFTGPRLRLSA